MLYAQAQTPIFGASAFLRGEVSELKDVMEKSENLGMCTFDQALFRLFEQGRITEDEALRNADSANNLRLKISLSRGNAQQIVDNTPDSLFCPTPTTISRICNLTDRGKPTRNVEVLNAPLITQSA